MGRLIDIDEARKEYSNLTDLTMSDTTLLLTLFGVLDNAPTVEAISKADYENRLKADMVDMLTDIQFEIEELRLDRPLFSRGYECYGHEDKTPTEIQQECSDIIQDKINELKGDKNEV